MTTDICTMTLEQILAGSRDVRNPERVRERWTSPVFDDVYREHGLTYRRPNVRLGLFHEVPTRRTPVYLNEMLSLCGGVFILRENGDVEVLE